MSSPTTPKLLSRKELLKISEDEETHRTQKEKDLIKDSLATEAISASGNVDDAFVTNAEEALKKLVEDDPSTKAAVESFGTPGSKEYIENIKKAHAYLQIQLVKCSHELCKRDYKNGDLKLCSACKLVYYCSKKCQISDWWFHKLTCTKTKEEKEALVKLSEKK